MLILNFARIMGSFKFKDFTLRDDNCGMKICSDSVLLGAWTFATPIPEASEIRSVLDIGAGSGLLSLLAASLCPDAIVIGIEIEQGAAEDSRINFSASPWAERLHLVESDFAGYIPDVAPDVIISNPPYFATGEKSADTARAGARHEGALTYAGLLRYASATLAPEGVLSMISPADRRDDIIFNAEMEGLKLRRICDVRTSLRKPPQRTMWLFSRNDGPIAHQEISLRAASGNYSPEYRRLVEPIYAWMP